MAIEILRPNALGDAENIPIATSGADHHHEDVNEASADDMTSTVSSHSNSWLLDLYNMPASSGSGEISKIVLHFRCYHGGTTAEHIRGHIKSGGVEDDGGEPGQAKETWEDFSAEWALNPADSEAWEWADIDALQIGIELRGNDDPYFYECYCTQIYVAVHYTPAGWSGGDVGGVAVAAIGKLNSVAIADILKVNGVA